MACSTPRYPLLAIDASAPTTWAGVKMGPGLLISREAEGDPTESLFETVRACLAEAGLGLAELGSIVYGAGPGSMLGARTASMAIRAWDGIAIAAAQSLFAFTSLELAAHLLAESNELPDSGLIAVDARRDSWNVLRLPVGPDARVELLSTQALEAAAEQGPLYALAGFPLWSRTAVPLRELAYDRDRAFGDGRFVERLRPIPFASPLALRESDYRKWTPRIHTTATKP